MPLLLNTLVDETILGAFKDEDGRLILVCKSGRATAIANNGGQIETESLSGYQLHNLMSSLGQTLKRELEVLQAIKKRLELANS